MLGAWGGGTSLPGHPAERQRCDSRARSQSGHSSSEALGDGAEGRNEQGEGWEGSGWGWGRPMGAGVENAALQPQAHQAAFQPCSSHSPKK